MDVDLIFISHARERMKSRGATIAEIKQVLSNHYFSAPGDSPDRMRYTGVLEDERVLSVVIRPPLDEQGPYTVITAFFEDEG